MHTRIMLLAGIIMFFVTPFAVLADTISSRNSAGLSVHLPAMNMQALAQELTQQHALLQQREQELNNYIEKNRLGTTDTVIAAIMPGGLLYAAYRKGRLAQVRAELVTITEQLSEFTRDLLTIREGMGDVTLAALH